MDMAALE